jgi:hypothetical protein
MVEDEYEDNTPLYFNINIFNKNSEMLQYICYAIGLEVYFFFTLYLYS